MAIRHKIEQPALDRELKFSFSRSSGPGGQHVNKVSTRVELRFDIPNSGLLCDEEKEILLTKLQNKLSKEGVLLVSAQTASSQLKNKEAAKEQFYKLINKALKVRKKRIPTSITPAAKEKRLKAKKAQAEKKERRRLSP
jgi:ribosome-associated protein